MTQSITNIPTELLRTLVTVVAHRSFTKAAQILGITQPAVSAQLKRLQSLLGAELFDKSAPGISLTASGEVVVDHARRILSINDQLLDLAGPRADNQSLQIGTTGDFAAGALSTALGRFHATRPELRFIVRSGGIDDLLRALRGGEMDVVYGLSGSVGHDARHHWAEPLVWVRGVDMAVPADGPVPIVSYGDECTFHRIAISSLNDEGRAGRLVFTGSSIGALCAAVNAGLGVMVVPRSCARLFDLLVCDDPSLPSLPEAFFGIYLRDGGGQVLREQVADAIAEEMRPLP